MIRRALLLGLAWRRPPRRDASDRLAVFLRGLGAGALVGAAIAGSRVWRQLRERRRRD